ncbi:alpha/beta hydrolase [Lysinibacillus yapensis]|uniref:Alpha/beta hydrolase n=1 Tax=Ureibacillus yapensis TaxID=2304605 RepID=A0A396SGE1_9BACL|nr:alpha/beta hydrolase [Lysinibacillus yapensis]RHW39348.1 alpha/beta hydrolase [Lysinibacillus yapensis]
MKLAMKIVLFVVITLVSIFLLLLLLREFKQYQINKESKRIIQNGGISEVKELTIGGISQYILVDGQNKENPFIIFLHGGPGQPFPFGVSSRNQFPVITEKFNAVYFDQRGSGKSYHKNIDLKSMNVEQFTSDANEVIDFVRKEYNQEKVYLVGMSWGSIIGLHLANRYPEKFFGYIGSDQIVNMKESQVLGKQWLKEIAKDDQEVLDKIESLGEPPYYGDVESKYSDLINKHYGFNYKDDQTKGANILKLAGRSLVSPDYSLKDIYAGFFSGATFSLIDSKELQQEIINTNYNDMRIFKTSIYLIQGKHDKVANFDLAKDYFNRIEAPKKKFITLENSAHMPNEEDFDVLIESIVQLNDH